MMREVIAQCYALSLTEISRTLCELLDWKRPNGKLKNHECRLLLERLRDQGVVSLPAVQPLGGRGPRRARLTSRRDPPPGITGPAGEFEPLRLIVMGAEDKEDLRLWAEYLERYHYLGHRIPMGDAELQLRRRPQAEAHLREALTLDPNSYLAQLGLRILFTDENKPAAAERRMREAVRLDPSDPDGHYHLGRLLLRMGQRKEAMQEFAEIKRLAREKQPPQLLSQIGGAKKGTKPDRTSAVPEVGKH